MAGVWHQSDRAQSLLMAHQETCVELTRMKKTFFSLTALTLLGSALAQGVPVSWNNSTLSTATYVVLDAKVIGNTALVSQEQMNGILAAIKRDSAGAIQRKYPNAKIATDPSTPGAIKVQPTFTTPSALVPWAKMSLRYDLTLSDGTVALNDTFSVMEVYRHSWNAMNYVGDRMISKMP